MSKHTNPQWLIERAQSALTAGDESAAKVYMLKASEVLTPRTTPRRGSRILDALRTFGDWVIGPAPETLNAPRIQHVPAIPK